jgi:cytoskeletal protein RodZ
VVAGMTSCGIELLPQDLMERRMAKGLTLHQIAAATKISLRYLEAIERGAFQELPGGLYTESYIRQYARALDDVDDALLDYYRSVFEPQRVQPVAESEPESRMDRLRGVVHSILGLTPHPALPESKHRAA